MGKKKILILIADDEPDILELLTYVLKREGYDIIQANDGEEALEKAFEHFPDIILLDVMMPKMDGVSVCRALRENPKFDKTIILFLTSRAEEYAEVAGFDAGADDYILKPIKLRALVRRLEAIQRRNQAIPQKAIHIGTISIDQEKYLLHKDGEEIKIPRREFDLLVLLMSQANKVVPREKIINEIWGQDLSIVDRTIDVHIRRIRIKIGDEYIQTIKGVGYKFVGD